MATMKDVADRAGVSLSTVSFALNNTRPVSTETRARIEAAASELGFRRNAVARALASRRTRILALCIPAARAGSTAMEFVVAAAEEARGRGYHLVMWPIGHDDAAEAEVLISQGLVDGVIVMDVYAADPRVEALTAAKTPLVLIGRTRTTALPSVDIDFEATCAAALDHLVSLGHQHIGLVNHSERAYESGYGPATRIVEGMETARAQRPASGRPSIYPVFADENAAAGRVATDRLLRAHAQITAIVVMNDDASFGVLEALRDHGRSVPADVSVLSVVSSDAERTKTFPLLTALLSPGRDLGRLAAQRLIDLLESTEPNRAAADLLPCAFASGTSTGQAPTPSRKSRNANITGISSQ